MRRGLEREARWSDSTLELSVAEKRYVRRSRGRTLRILSRIGPKSMSRSLSASSMTRCLRPRREKPLVFSRWSSNRPGVATTMCGFFPSAMDCETMSIPPTIVAHRTAIVDPRLSNDWEIWYANSRVGAKMSPKSDWGFSMSAEELSAIVLISLP